MSPCGSLFRIVVCAVHLFASAGISMAAERNIGKVVSLRGKATIERGDARLDAAQNSDIQPRDLITTAEDSRVKVQFVDDSILTVGEKSRLLIREFTYEKGKQGKSVYNLLEGKMHSVVGHTRFEVQTPTATLNARDAIIYVEISDGGSK